LVLVAACGEVNQTRHLDGGVDSPGGDAAPDAHVPTCYGQAFGSPSYVSVLNSQGSEVYLRLSADELTAYFCRLGSAAPTQGITASRVSVTSTFSTPTTLVITNNNSAEVMSPSVTADGLTLYFTSNRSGTAGLHDIYRATRATTTTDFGSIANVSELNTSADEQDVYAVPDGSAVYFSSSRSNGQIYSIYRAAKSGGSGGTFGAPVEVLAMAAKDVSYPVVSPDELTLFYQVGMDMFETHRASTTAPFVAGTALTALNTTQSSEFPDWISADGCRLYFQTDRPGGAGGLDFMVAARTPL